MFTYCPINEYLVYGLLFQGVVINFFYYCHEFIEGETNPFFNNKIKTVKLNNPPKVKICQIITVI